MIRFLARVAWFVWCWLELAAFTLLLYLLSFLPRRLLTPWYFPLFRLWCRLFVHALGVDLRLQQKNTRPLPKHYILMSGVPGAENWEAALEEPALVGESAPAVACR